MPGPTKILLMGGNGLVGRQIRDVLPGSGVIATYRRNPERNGLVLDITDHQAVRRAVRKIKPDVVILAAAEAYVEGCEREPESTRRVNVDATRVIAEESQAVGSLLVVFSSEYVFSGGAGNYREEDERGPINEYGRQKSELEDIALASGNALVCRTSGVYGPDPTRKNFVYQVVDRLRRGESFDVPSDQSITPTYAPALAAAVLQLAKMRAAGVFHVAGPRVLNRVAFARLVAESFGLPLELICPRPTSELQLIAPCPLRCGPNVDKLRHALGHDLPDVDLSIRAMADSESSRQ